MHRLVELFIAGGPVMWPILALSVAGMAILVWKAFEIRAGRRGNVVTLFHDRGDRYISKGLFPA